MRSPLTEVTLSHDGAELARLTLPLGEYVIGRDPAAEIRADTPELSRRHALLTIGSEGIFIEDLRSFNGTFIGEQPLIGSVPVVLGQPIRLGAVTLLVRPGTSAPASSDSAGAMIAKLVPSEAFTLKRYAVGAQVARGGMGAILEAQQAAMKRRVAMKVMLYDAEPADVARFVGEAQITGQLDHPNIVPIYELGVDENERLFYTMKFVRGTTLKKVCERLAEGEAAAEKTYPLATLLTIFQKACDAVAFAHSKHVIHRDLKPDNIMLGDFGEVLVMDWGLAKVLSERPDGEAPAPVPAHARRSVIADVRVEESFGGTMAGTIMGSPQYMAPEQARGETEAVDHRADIYALGAILFQLLFFRPPVSGTRSSEVIAKVQQGHLDWTPPKKPVPDSLLAVCRKALALEAEDRYPNVAELQRDIAAYQTGFLTSAEKPTWFKRAALAIKRNKTVSLATAAVLLVSASFGTKAVLEGRRAERALAELRKTAPALRQLAESEASVQRFDSALEKVDAAHALDPSRVEDLWRRAWLFIGMEKWSDAVAAIRTARAADVAHANLADILPVVEQLAATEEAKRWTPERVPTLSRHLQNVGALGEMIALSAKLKLGAEPRRDLVAQRVGQWLGYKTKFSVIVTNDGFVQLSLYGLPVDTIEPLRGLPIDRLDLGATNVTDLSPLRGMKLTSINLYLSRVTDISPLAGMPMREADFNGANWIRDFTPLRGAPLERFNSFGPRILDLSFLRGAPLRFVIIQGAEATSLDFVKDAPVEELVAGGNHVADLSPLRGKALRKLHLGGNMVRDLTPVLGLPITDLIIDNNPIADFSQLLALPKLDQLLTNAPPEKLTSLRKHPTLRLIKNNTPTYVPVAEFWAACDAKQAGPK